MTGATYDRIHRELVAVRGSAVGKPCSHPVCKARATGYALLTHPTRIDVNSHGKLVRLSLDHDDYGPACTRHNAQMDHGGNWLRCPHGHDRATFGTDSKGYCRGCAREKNKRQHRRRMNLRQQAGTTPTTGTTHTQIGGQS